MKQLTSNEITSINGGLSPCDSWWGCTLFSVTISLAATAVSGPVGGWAGSIIGSATCSYICSKS